MLLYDLLKWLSWKAMCNLRKLKKKKKKKKKKVFIYAAVKSGLGCMVNPTMS